MCDECDIAELHVLRQARIIAEIDPRSGCRIEETLDLLSTPGATDEIRAAEAEIARGEAIGADELRRLPGGLPDRRACPDCPRRTHRPSR